MDLKETDVCVLNSSGSVAGSCEWGNEPSCSIKEGNSWGVEQPLKKVPALRSWLLLTTALEKMLSEFHPPHHKPWSIIILTPISFLIFHGGHFQINFPSKQRSLEGRTWTCIVVLSKALYNMGSTSDLISSRGVFSRITWRLSSKVTVAWIDFGTENTLLQTHV
jgi:hypothetical protein